MALDSSMQTSYIQWRSATDNQITIIISDRQGPLVFNSEQYRAKAAEYKKRGEQTNTPEEIRGFKNLERIFREMAENEEWMEHNSDKIVHPPNQD
jgi:hypothetical protein